MRPRFHQNPKQLIAIGVRHDVGAHLVAPANAARIGAQNRLANLVQKWCQRKGALVWLDHVGAGEVQCLAAPARRPVHRLDQTRRDVADLRILALLEPVGEQDGAGQEIAQVVIDLADRGAERGEAGLLRERRAQTLLHAPELGLHQADLVAPLGHRQARAGVFGPAPEGDDALGDPPQRPDDHQLQRRIDQERRQQRDHDRERQNAPRVVDHRIPESLLAQADVDQHLGPLR